MAKGKTITFANFKGGVGKTTASVMSAYVASKGGKKVLLIDLDPQHNATDIIFKTYGIDEKEYNTVFDGITKNDLTDSIYEMDENLHLIPSDLDLVGFSRYLYSVTRDVKKQPLILNKLIRELKTHYDYIFIDVPPTISEITNNAIVASDYVLLIMQTHEQSLTASVQFVDYLRDMQSYNPEIDLLGVVAYMVDNRGRVDKSVLKDASDIFGDILFDNKIMHRQRVKSFGRDGITELDFHDTETMDMFRNIMTEFEERVEAL